MKILFPIAEVMGIYKIGGLGDVGAALPKALHSLKCDVRLVLPKHPEIGNHHNEIEIARFEVNYHQEMLSVFVEMCYLPGTSVPVYLIKEDKYLSTRSDAGDNHADKFAVFSLCVSHWLMHHMPHWQPQVIHCHDWHTALIPVILKHKYETNRYKYVITIHNLAYQGVTTTPVLKYLELPAQNCRILSWDHEDGDLNILLEGILHSDQVTTVSPTYASEILTEIFGEKINQILAGKNGVITGILNGLDNQEFDPLLDKSLPHRFDKSNWKEMRGKNRQQLCDELGMSNDEKMFIGFVGRVDPYQKGIGLIIEALNKKMLPPEGCQFVFLGCGDPSLESELHRAGDNHPNVRIITRFDEALARRIYGSAHMMLIPSRFEPCGLVQLIAMRYGSIPVARSVGGLIDTISHKETGYLFSEFSVEKMMDTINEAIEDIFDESKYNKMVDEAMNKDWSWDKSAREYLELYEKMLLES